MNVTLTEINDVLTNDKGSLWRKLRNLEGEINQIIEGLDMEDIKKNA